MYKYYIVVLISVFYSSGLKADVVPNLLASIRDSIGVENSNGKKVIIHQVVAKDTYYSIGRRYKVPPKTISDFNDNKFLQIGVVIKVPTDIPFNDKMVSGVAPPETLGSKTIEYTVQPKDNLHALSIRYGTTVDEIKRASNINSISLSIGQILKIPVKDLNQQNANSQTVSAPAASSTAPGNAATQRVTPTATTELKTEIIPEAKPAIKTAKKDNNTVPSPPAEEFVEHVVASNETMYSIASKHKMTVAQLMAKNKMTTSSLTVGQHLLIRGEWPKEELVLTEDNETDTAASIGSLKNPNLKYPSSRYGLNEMDEKGTAVWIADQNLDASKMYVLHRSAQIGTVMKITNPMSNRTTFAKVVGKFTENESTKDVIVVMTKAVADSLGALDKRFLCNISYRGEEQQAQ